MPDDFSFFDGPPPDGILGWATGDVADAEPLTIRGLERAAQLIREQRATPGRIITSLATIESARYWARQGEVGAELGWAELIALPKWRFLRRLHLVGQIERNLRAAESLRHTFG